MTTTTSLNTSSSRLSNSEIAEKISKRPLVMIGMMGSGKTAIGKRVASTLGLGFVDSDAEIVEAAGRSISDIFEEYGEPEFRNLERRVIARLLEDSNHIIATGGGAYMNGDTRAAINSAGICLWLKAELDILYERVSRRNTRPLLNTDDPKQTLKELMETRDPIYAQAHITVQSGVQSHEIVVESALQAISDFLIENKL